MNTKAKGAYNENKSIAILEKSGYRCTRAAASLGAWDIIGISATDMVLVQVKSNRWPRDIEMAELRDFPCPTNCRRLIHRWDDYKHQPLVKVI